MKTTLLFIISLSILSACSKKETSPGIQHELAGNWRLLQITDHDAGTVIQKNPEQTGHVELTLLFSSNSRGDITAKTPVNTLNGSFTIYENRSLNVQGEYTKVNEHAFGSVFLCNLQFVSDYSFDDNRRLVINTSSRKTLLLEKR
jgi:hypothetical protein